MKLKNRFLDQNEAKYLQQITTKLKTACGLSVITKRQTNHNHIKKFAIKHETDNRKRY